MAVMSRSADPLPARFLLYWTVATAAGLSVSFVGVTLATYFILWNTLGRRTLPGEWACILAALALTLTTPLGISQWLVLRRTRLQIRSWIPATTIGFIAGIVPVFYVLIWGGTLGLSGVAGLGALLGAPIGVAQWLILRRRLKRSTLWILGTTAASAGAAVLAGWVGASPAVSSLPGAVLLVPVLLPGALFGAITGLLFRRLVADSPGGE